MPVPGTTGAPGLPWLAQTTRPGPCLLSCKAPPNPVQDPQPGPVQAASCPTCEAPAPTPRSSQPQRCPVPRSGLDEAGRRLPTTPGLRAGRRDRGVCSPRGLPPLRGGSSQLCHHQARGGGARLSLARPCKALLPRALHEGVTRGTWGLVRGGAGGTAACPPPRTAACARTQPPCERERVSHEGTGHPSSLGQPLPVLPVSLRL